MNNLVLNQNKQFKFPVKCLWENVRRKVFDKMRIKNDFEPDLIIHFNVFGEQNYILQAVDTISEVKENLFSRNTDIDVHFSDSPVSGRGAELRWFQLIIN